MIYRPMGKTGLQVSALSMGCGHLPKDPDECDALLRAAVDAGINYFETAVPYCDGQCQQKTGRGLQPVRDKVMISAKAGITLEGEQEGVEATTGDSFRREILDVQLPNLRTDHAEWCQVGWFSANKIDALRQKGGVLDALHRLIDEGVIDHIGFTSHDTPENVVKIIETGIFESCILQYNLLNQSYAPALEAARQHGVAVVVMGPLHGGMLARPEMALRDLVSNATDTSRAGLQFVLANPAVSTACSGMHRISDLEENLKNIQPDAEQQAADVEEMKQVFDRFKEARKTMCTGCNYCRPCPAGVDISRNLRIRNYLKVYDRQDAARQAYTQIPADARADQCTDCAQCEEKCPNDLPVRELLKETAELCG